MARALKTFMCLMDFIITITRTKTWGPLTVKHPQNIFLFGHFADWIMCFGETDLAFSLQTHLEHVQSLTRNT